jgi:hypothetical protein
LLWQLKTKSVPKFPTWINLRRKQAAPLKPKGTFIIVSKSLVHPIIHIPFIEGNDGAFGQDRGMFQEHVIVPCSLAVTHQESAYFLPDTSVF